MLAVKNIRERKQLSQADLAKMVKVTRAHLCKIEKGKVGASMGLIKRLAEALEVTSQELMGEEETTKVEYDSEEVSEAIEKAFRCYKDEFDKKTVVKIGIQLFKIHVAEKALKDNKDSLDGFKKDLEMKEIVGLAARCYLREAK